MDAPQVVVVGSGLAGVSVAVPLVERGIRVLMLDFGHRESVAPTIDPSRGLREVRQRTDQWKMIVGDQRLDGAHAHASSPKLRVASHRHVFAHYNSRYRIVARNFTVVGSLAEGGLSNAWGAGVSMFDDDDLAEFPISLADLLPSYRRVSKRIGVSGSNDDDLSTFHGTDDSLLPAVRTSGNLRAFYSRYCASPRSAWARGFRIGHGRNAVLTEDRPHRSGCIYCGRCLWGCGQGAIYSATADLAQLRKKATFSYRDGLFVERIVKVDSGWRVVARNERTTTTATFKAKRIVLACGAIGSAKLVLDALRLHNRRIPMQSTPAAGFGLLLLQRKLARMTDDHAFGLGQLSFRAELPGPHPGYVCGSLFSADTLPASEFIAQLPFAYPLSRRIVRIGQPQLIVGNAYFAGSHRRNALRLDRDGRLEVSADSDAELLPVAKTFARRLGHMASRYGALLIPRTFRLLGPGQDIHYGATAPMRAHPRANETNALGEVAGLPGVYIADGASLTSLPAKPPSLTIMANADRIGTLLADTIS